MEVEHGGWGARRVSRRLGGDDRHGERRTRDDDGGTGYVLGVQRCSHLQGKIAERELRLDRGDAAAVQVHLTGEGGERSAQAIPGEDDRLLPGPAQPPDRRVPAHGPCEAP